MEIKIKAVLIVNCTKLNLTHHLELIEPLVRLINDANNRKIPTYIANVIHDDYPNENKLPFKTLGAKECEIELFTNKINDEIINELYDLIKDDDDGYVLLAGSDLLPHVFQLRFNNIHLCFIPECCETETIRGIHGEAFQYYFNELPVFEKYQDAFLPEIGDVS